MLGSTEINQFIHHLVNDQRLSKRIREDGILIKGKRYEWLACVPFDGGAQSTGNMKTMAMLFLERRRYLERS